MLAIIYDFFIHMWTYFLKEKSEVFSKFKELTNIVVGEIGKIFFWQTMVGNIPHMKILNSLKIIEYAIS